MDILNVCIFLNIMQLSFYTNQLYLHLVTTNKVKCLMNKNQQSKKIKKEEKLLIQFFNMCYVILR